ncbi:calcium-binding protein [Apiospora aurea]|uniref:Calcium-binding protein n=1 Tax=Apiospora aurea TaxID=335848 RepID=A0ABR1Q5R1_9PEZI
MRSTILVTLSLLGGALAHGDHGGSQKPMVDEKADWMTKHMAEEHHIADFDASSFFALHDYDADGHWEHEEIQRTYGLMDESNAGVPQSRKADIAHEVASLMDTDHDGFVSRAEFVDFINAGKTLPDMGTGPGHHGDDEYEYEIHHWEKYHGDDTTMEDLVHPEDIAHFKKHEEMEAAEERVEQMNRMHIVEGNIPKLFQRAG